MRVTIMKMKRGDILWNRGKQTFSINGKTINILGFAGPVLSVATTYSHHCSMKKKAIDNMQICARLCSNKTIDNNRWQAIFGPWNTLS